MDLGSAVLSAELALELLDDEVRERVVLCPAPLVEGLVVAAVAAAGGAGSEEVASEAAGALAGKIGHLGTMPVATAADAPADADELAGSFVVANPHGLHARPGRTSWSRRCAAAMRTRGSATGAPNRNGLTQAAFRRSPHWACGPATRWRCGYRVARPQRPWTMFWRWPRATLTSGNRDPWRPRRPRSTHRSAPPPG